MSGITPQTPGLITSRQRGSWAGRGLLDSVHGLAFVGLALAEAGLILALVIELSDAAVIFPLLLIPPTLLAVRRLANVVRRLSGQWCAVAIAKPYRAYPEPEPGAGAWRRFGRTGGQMVTEAATWRDLLWMTLDPLAIWVIPFIPIAVMAWGLFGVLMPAYWSPIVHAGGTYW